MWNCNINLSRDFLKNFVDFANKNKEALAILKIPYLSLLFTSGPIEKPFCPLKTKIKTYKEFHKFYKHYNESIQRCLIYLLVLYVSTEKLSSFEGQN